MNKNEQSFVLKDSIVALDVKFFNEGDKYALMGSVTTSHVMNGKRKKGFVETGTSGVKPLLKKSSKGSKGQNCNSDNNQVKNPDDFKDEPKIHPTYFVYFQDNNLGVDNQVRIHI